MVDTCEVALREAARIINVMREQGVSTAGREAVLSWSDATASRGSEQPSLSMGLKLLRDLRLVSEAPGDKVVFDQRLRATGSEPALYIERFPGDLVAVVLHRVMGIPVLRAEILRILVYCAMNTGEGRVEWEWVPPQARANPAWLWLQRIGTAKQTDTGLSLDHALLPYVADIREPAISLSHADLDARLALQLQRSVLAEELVTKLEKARLVAAGADYLADAVARVSDNDARAGYDVQSFEVTGKPRLIEVKCSAGPREQFFLSDNEHRVAKANKDAYWLAWIGWGVDLPDGAIDLVWVQDVARVLREKPSPWRVSASGMVVEAIGDDSGIRSSP